MLKSSYSNERVFSEKSMKVHYVDMGLVLATLWYEQLCV